MIGLPTGMQIWIVAGVTDMRRGFVGLSGMVQTAAIFCSAVVLASQIHHSHSSGTTL